MDWWVNILETISNLRKATHKYDGENSAVQAP